jgi:hypothetical protein
MTFYNRKMLGTPRQEQIEVFDLVALVPKNSNMFYDDYTKEGALPIARSVARFVGGL